MKAWIVRETGEVRLPQDKEWFRDECGHIIQAKHNWSISPMPILSVTPLPTREEVKEVEFEIFHKLYPDIHSNSLQGNYYHAGFTGCYDYLFGHTNCTRPAVEDMTPQERREWIYG